MHDRNFLVAVACLITAGSTSGSVVITFEDIAPGFQSPTFLAAYGISNVSSGGSVGALGPSVMNYAGAPVLLPSGTHALAQSWSSLDTNQPHWLAFDFATPLASFGLTRIGTTGGGSTDVWQAKFYDTANNYLGSFGDGPLINAPATPFTFTAPTGTTIGRLVLQSTWTAFATYRNIPVDDFVLSPAPEPTSLAFLGTAAAVLVIRRRKA